MSEMPDIDWEILVGRIRAGRCVPFLGAAANISSVSLKYKGTPLGADVSKKLAATLAVGPRDPENLPRVSLHLEVRKDRPYLEEQIEKLIDAGSCQPSPLLRLLAELPFDLIVTTNYDCLMEQALKEAGRDYRVLVQPPLGFRPNAPELAALAGYTGVIVYKIHGTFGDGDRASSDLILTEEDYIVFLTAVTGTADRIGVPNLITGRLQTRSLLFLGYGLEDWDFQVLYKTLVESLESRKKFKSYAIQKSPNQDWKLFWEKKGVVIYDCDVYAFAAGLRGQYPFPPPPGPAIPPPRAADSNA